MLFFFSAFLAEEEREALSTSLREAGEWMYEDGFGSTTEVCAGVGRARCAIFLAELTYPHSAFEIFFSPPWFQVLLDKTAELNKTAKAIFYRVREMNERPAAIQRLRQSLNMTEYLMTYVRNFTANATANETEWITAEELKTLETLYNETAEWLAEKSKAQEELALTEAPVLKVCE